MNIALKNTRLDFLSDFNKYLASIPKKSHAWNDWDDWDEAYLYRPLEFDDEDLINQDFDDLFSQTFGIKQKPRKKHKYSEEDDEDDIARYDEYWNALKGKPKGNKHHRGTRGRGKKKQELTNNFVVDSLINQKKKIYFYLDINDKTIYRKIKNIKDFISFCEDKGYYLSDNELGKALRMSEVHACLNTREKLTNNKNVITLSDKYDSLVWECESLSEYY